MRLEPGELERVEARANSGSLVLPWPFLSVGDTVYLREGPLAGMD